MDFGEEENTNYSQDYMDEDLFPNFAPPETVAPPKENRGNFLIEYKNKEYQSVYYPFTMDMMDGEMPIIFQEMDNEDRFLFSPPPNDIVDGQERQNLEEWFQEPNPSFQAPIFTYQTVEHTKDLTLNGMIVDIYQLNLDSPQTIRERVVDVYKEPAQWFFHLCWLAFLYIEKQEDLENLPNQSFLTFTFNVNVHYKHMGDKGIVTKIDSTLQMSIVLDLQKLISEPYWNPYTEHRSFTKTKENYVLFYQYVQSKLSKMFTKTKYDLEAENSEGWMDETEIEKKFKIDGFENIKRLTFQFDKRILAKKGKKPVRAWKRVRF
jgi:hypothetical protein